MSLALEISAFLPLLGIELSLVMILDHLRSLCLHGLCNLLPIGSKVSNVIDEVLLFWYGPIAGSFGG